MSQWNIFKSIHQHWSKKVATGHWRYLTPSDTRAGPTIWSLMMPAHIIILSPPCLRWMREERWCPKMTNLFDELSGWKWVKFFFPSHEELCYEWIFAHFQSCSIKYLSSIFCRIGLHWSKKSAKISIRFNLGRLRIWPFLSWGTVHWKSLYRSLVVAKFFFYCFDRYTFINFTDHKSLLVLW